MPQRIVEPAPAKVNLTLEVLGRRADGFHELSSLVAFAHDACDRLTFEPTAAVGVTVTGPAAGAIAGENLVARALAAIAAAGPGLRLGHVTLEKYLPVASGIGGGSADAAATLRAVRHANPQMADRIDWGKLAASLGSDVPVCLEGRPCLMQGVGDRLTPFSMPGRLSAVLVNPMVAVPADKTAQVFRALALAPGDAVAPGSRPAGFATTSNFVAHMRATGNALTGPASRVVPKITEVLAALRSDGRCRLAQMSGAGPTCFGIYDDMAEARSAAAGVAARYPSWWVCATALG